MNFIHITQPTHFYNATLLQVSTVGTFYMSNDKKSKHKLDSSITSIKKIIQNKSVKMLLHQKYDKNQYEDCIIKIVLSSKALQTVQWKINKKLHQKTKTNGTLKIETNQTLRITIVCNHTKHKRLRKNQHKLYCKCSNLRRVKQKMRLFWIIWSNEKHITRENNVSHSKTDEITAK